MISPVRKPESCSSFAKIGRIRSVGIADGRPTILRGLARMS
jgi:hypothetical protein